MKTAIGDPMTARQAEIHRFMLAYQAEHLMPTSHREIGRRFGITSPNGVRCHIIALQKKGYVRVNGKGMPRSIIAIDPDARRCECCGQAIRHATETEGGDQ